MVVAMTLLVAVLGCRSAPTARGGGEDPAALLRDGGIEEIITRGMRAFSLPADPAAREAYARAVLARMAGPASSSARVDAVVALEGSWAASMAPGKETSLQRSLHAALTDPDFSGYADYALEVREWLDVTVSGDEATASFIAVPSYRRNSNQVVSAEGGWVDDHEQRFDVRLVFEDGRWKLLDEATRRTDGVTGY